MDALEPRDAAALGAARAGPISAAWRALDGNATTVGRDFVGAYITCIEGGCASRDLHAAAAASFILRDGAAGQGQCAVVRDAATIGSVAICDTTITQLLTIRMFERVLTFERSSTQTLERSNTNLIQSL